MEEFVTADNHFADYGIVLHNDRPWAYPNPNFDPDQPFDFKTNNDRAVDLKAHDEEMIEIWNSIVGKKDHVRILGDFARNNHKKYIDALNGKKTLFKGNHDDMNGDAYRSFEEVVDTTDLNQLKTTCSKWLKRYNKMDRDDFINGMIMNIWNHFADLNDFECIDQMAAETYRKFQGVHEMGKAQKMGVKKKVRGKYTDLPVTFSHYGMKTWSHSPYGAWQLYGHSHGRLPEFDNMFSFDVGVDIWGYSPIPWFVIKAKMKVIEENIKKIGDRYVDGEAAARGTYSKDPKERVIATRKKNKKIAKDAGMKIVNKYWPNTNGESQ